MNNDVEQALARASEARRRGDNLAAKQWLEQALAADGDCGPAHNSLGLLALGSRDPGAAASHFVRATEIDPNVPPVWLNLAEAYRLLDRADDELNALDRALSLEPYLFPALFRKGQALERTGRGGDAVRAYRALLSIVGDRKNLAPQLQAPLEHARRIVTAADESRVERLSGSLDAVLARFPDEDFERVRAYAEHLAGRRKIYHHEPTAGHFPFLPALEFFPRSLTPWFDRLESATDAVRAELISLWQDEDGFRPYVRFDASEPVNQWAELNHSPKWSAFFLLEDGQRVESNLARCPDTARLLDTLPMLDIPGKSPTAMFSILKPKTRIPAHTGSSNVRSTVHLPLVVPEGCGFRVGATTRPWRVGEAWAFDDTIEHEAWNNSDQPRAVLILDIWNPLLSGAEREAVRVLG